MTGQTGNKVEGMMDTRKIKKNYFNRKVDLHKQERLIEEGKTRKVAEEGGKIKIHYFI
jgi:hypothetical protein